MLKWLLRGRVRSFGRRYDYDVTYMNEILDRDAAAFLRFSQVAALSARSGPVPRAAWFAAKLAATIAEDCGPCTQLVTKMADDAGVPPQIVRAIVEGDEGNMDDDARLGWSFARATLAHDPESDRWREQIISKWGERAVVVLALGIAASRMFPTVKYAMVHGHSCQRIRVDGVDLVPLARHDQVVCAA